MRDILVPSLPGVGYAPLRVTEQECAACFVTSQSSEKAAGLSGRSTLPYGRARVWAGKEHCGCWDLTSCPNTGHIPNPACGSYSPIASDFKPGVPWNMAALQVAALELTFTPSLLRSADHRSHGEPLPYPPALPSLPQQPLPGPTRLGPPHPCGAAAVGAEPPES